MLAGVAAVNIGYGFGQNGWIRPELRLGWRQNISVDVGETIARFVYRRFATSPCHPLQSRAAARSRAST